MCSAHGACSLVWVWRREFGLMEALLIGRFAQITPIACLMGSSSPARGVAVWTQPSEESLPRGCWLERVEAS